MMLPSATSRGVGIFPHQAILDVLCIYKIYACISLYNINSLKTSILSSESSSDKFDRYLQQKEKAQSPFRLQAPFVITLRHHLHTIHSFLSSSNRCQFQFSDFSCFWLNLCHPLLLFFDLLKYCRQFPLIPKSS